jgi:hypothetical protein
MCFTPNVYVGENIRINMLVETLNECALHQMYMLERTPNEYGGENTKLIMLEWRKHQMNVFYTKCICWREHQMNMVEKTPN